MEQHHQLHTMLFMEKSYTSKASIQTHPKRRLIADCLHKLTDDERLSDDVFALTMSMFDQFIARTSSSKLADDRFCQLIALSCYSMAKKLRTNTLVNNENEQTSLIFTMENYSDEDIFSAEQLIAETLDWDFAYFVPHDYVQIFFGKMFTSDDRAQICLHVHILLSLAICELSTFTMAPSLLACACLKAAMKGLGVAANQQMDEFIFQTLRCNRTELIRSQCSIEQLLQACLQDIAPSPRRRCLAPIDLSPQPRAKVR